MSAEDYEPLVPIVEEIRREVAVIARADSAERARGGRGERPRKRLEPSPPPSLARPAGRIARRVALVAAPLALLGGVALAAHFGLGGEEAPVNSAPTAIAEGRGWELSGYRREGQLCVALAAGPKVSTSCGPAPGPLRVTSALGVAGRVVAGLGGPGVRSVAVRVGSLERSVRIRAPLDRAAAAEAGVRAGSGWFFAFFPADRAEGPVRTPARVVARDGRGRRLGPASVDCSLGAQYRACARAASAQAQAELQR